MVSGIRPRTLHRAGKESPKKKPIESKVSVYLATKKEDEEFRMLLHENGFMWNNGMSLISRSNWASDPKDYQIHFVYPNKIVTYSGERTEDTLTFTEFKKRYFGEDVNLSQETANCDKSNVNRLQIAAMAMQGILSNTDLFKNVLETGMEILTGEHISYRSVAKASLIFADTLIAEAEKGGEDGED